MPKLQLHVHVYLDVHARCKICAFKTTIDCRKHSILGSPILINVILSLADVNNEFDVIHALGFMGNCKLQDVSDRRN